jgi:hypothetical protein
MAKFGTYPLGQQLRYRRGNESFTTMTATIKTWGPHSFAVPLQLFADHNLLQPPENWLGVRELQTHIFGRAAGAAVQRSQLRRRDAAVFSTPVYCYGEL